MEVRSFINAIVIPRVERVAHGTHPLPVPRRGFRRAECSILHRLRTGIAFTFETLERFGRADTPAVLVMVPLRTYHMGFVRVAVNFGNA